MHHPTSRIRHFAAAIVLTFAGAGFVRAQDAETRKHLMHDLGGPFIIYRSGVQSELKLTEAQKVSLLQAQPKIVQETRQVEANLNDRPAEERERTMQSYRVEAYKKFWQTLAVILDGDQLARFHQLELQHEGPAGLFRPEISPVLKITDEERRQILLVISDMQEQMSPLLKQANSGGDPHEILPKVIQIINDHEQTVEAKLDPSQRKLWQEMRGKPFDTLTDWD